MTTNLGALHLHTLDKICRRTALNIARSTPRRPPVIHWLINL